MGVVVVVGGLNVDNTGKPDKERTKGCLPTYHQHQGREGGSKKKREEEQKKRRVIKF